MRMWKLRQRQAYVTGHRVASIAQQNGCRTWVRWERVTKLSWDTSLACTSRKNLWGKKSPSHLCSNSQADQRASVANFCALINCKILVRRSNDTVVRLKSALDITFLQPRKEPMKKSVAGKQYRFQRMWKQRHVPACISTSCVLPLRGRMGTELESLDRWRNGLTGCYSCYACGLWSKFCEQKPNHREPPWSFFFKMSISAPQIQCPSSISDDTIVMLPSSTRSFPLETMIEGTQNT